MARDASPEHVDHLTTISKAKGFLGREFLTWLWYTAETIKERQKVADRNGDKELEFDLWVDDRVVLESSAGQAQQNVLKGGDPSQSREAAAALQTGKTVRELKVGFNVKGYGEYTAILGCDELTPRSLKLPNPKDENAPASTDPDELPIALRVRHLDTFLACLDGLFVKFLDARTAESWESEGLKEMRDWVKKRQKGETDTLH